MTLMVMFLLLTACATGQDMLQDRRQLAGDIAAKADMTPFRLDAGRFTLQGRKRINAPETKMAQIHYSGADDEIVPPMIAKAFIAELPRKTCTRHRVIESATHRNWAQIWPNLAADMPDC